MNMKRRRALGVLVIVALAVGVALPGIWWMNRTSTSVGSLARFEQTASGGRQVRPVPALPTNIAVHSGRVEDAPVGATAPVAIRVDDIGVDAPVRSVGQESNGEMEIPESVAEIGWYRPGAMPGRPGSAVLAGHVDSRSQGRGAFFRLSELQPGARITVTDTRRAEHQFEVVARRQFPKQQLPADLFATTGEPRLTLITCGGVFDNAASSYRDNIVVYAVAV